MKKYKELIKNIGLLSISNFGTKILSFILIPLYTSALSTTEYGTFDIYSATVSLAIPVLTWNIADAVVRFSLDGNYAYDEIISVGIRRFFWSTCIVSTVIGINSVLRIVPLFEQYAFLFCVLYFGEAFYSLLSQFARGMDRFSDIVVAGVFNSCTLFFFNYLFLIVLKLGLNGYFLAYCFSYFIPIVYYIFRLNLWKYILSWNNNSDLRKEMFRYSKPLVFDTLSWWMINISDRYVVTWICGVAVNGVYSVAYKIPSILNILQSIFNSAWLVSAVKSFGDNDTFYKKVYQIYNCGLVIICSILISSNRIIARILFANEFYMAWKYAPFLTISVLFGALSGLMGGVFSAAKKSIILAKTTILGAVVNGILNLILVRYFGPSGAALATLAAYFFVWAVRLKNVKHIVKLDVNLMRDLFSYLILIMQSILMLLIHTVGILCICEIVLFVLIMFLYSKELKSLREKILLLAGNRDKK